MPVDDRIERLDKDKRLDRLVLQHRFGGIAKSETTHDNI
jgi:hypothetical protein